MVNKPSMESNRLDHFIQKNFATRVIGASTGVIAAVVTLPLWWIGAFAGTVAGVGKFVGLKLGLTNKNIKSEEKISDSDAVKKVATAVSKPFFLHFTFVFTQSRALFQKRIQV